MGSGSFGGGGSGGSGGGGSGVGGYRFQGGKTVSGAPSFAKVEKDVDDIRAKLPKEYALKLFRSSMMEAVYSALFELSVHIFQNRSWGKVTERFEVRGGPGCLFRWVHAVLQQAEADEPNTKFREIAQLALEDFVIRALGSDPDLYMAGSGDQIVAALDKRVFDSTSGFFLGFLLRRMIEREFGAVSENTEQQIGTIAQQLADRIVGSFESKFYAKGQTTHRDLFRVIQENPDWFWDLLRK